MALQCHSSLFTNRVVAGISAVPRFAASKPVVDKLVADEVSTYPDITCKLTNSNMGKKGEPFYLDGITRMRKRRCT